MQALTGLMMLLLAIFALPALLRFAVPITAAVAGGSAGSGSPVADPGNLATGAVNLGRSALVDLRGSAAGGSSGGAGARTGRAGRALRARVSRRPLKAAALRRGRSCFQRRVGGGSTSAAVGAAAEPAEAQQAAAQPPPESSGA